MFFRSNVARAFDKLADVHRPVDNPIASEQVKGGARPGFPQVIHSPDDAELVWPNGFELPVDRDTFVAELNAERFGLHKRRSEQ